jgi:hypothetical protein
MLTTAGGSQNSDGSTVSFYAGDTQRGRAIALHLNAQTTDKQSTLRLVRMWTKEAAQGSGAKQALTHAFVMHQSTTPSLEPFQLIT